MIGRLLWLIFLCGMLSAAAGPSTASVRGCSSRETVYPRTDDGKIREVPLVTGKVLRHTVPGEYLEVIGSRRRRITCWLQTSEGWLAYDPLLLSGTPLKPRAGRPDCLQGNTAYVTSGMNIRAAASTGSAIVANARAGDSFTVLESRIGSKWCWLRISQGWLANTARVQSKKPVQGVSSSPERPQPAERSDIDNCCFVDRQCRTEREWIDGYWAYQNNQCGAPRQLSVATSSRPRIEGSEAFVSLVIETLDLMERRVPELYQYVVSVTSLIAEHGPENPAGATAYIGTGKTTMSMSNFDGPMPVILYIGAATLVHEACHHHGHDINEDTGEFDHQLCYQAAHDASYAINPWKPHKGRLSEWN